MILSSAITPGLLPGMTAAAAYVVSALTGTRSSPQVARGALLVAWLAHAAMIVAGLAGGTPRFGFAPALSVTAWLVMTLYAIEQKMLPRLHARWALAGLGAAAVGLALLFPGQIHQASASPWLPLHWVLGIASYGMFGAAVVHAWLMTRAERRIRLGSDPDSGIPLLTLERITFHFVTAGFILLSATLLAGGLFGEILYGRAWRLDHKTLFSLLSWAVFAVLLVGRARFGWRGKRAVRVLYVGAALLLLGYAGSRFVMEVLLQRAGS